jgi:hypothetical protein
VYNAIKAQKGGFEMDELQFTTGVLFTYLLIVLFFLVLEVIAMWKIFAKAGEKGWKAIIPIYNIYVMYKVAWKTMFFWIFLGISVVGGFISGFIAGLTGNDPNILLTILLLIPVLVLTIIYYHKISKSFGKGVGFTIGLIFLGFVFMLILAFGSARYIGPGGVAKDKPELETQGAV